MQDLIDKIASLGACKPALKFLDEWVGAPRECFEHMEHGSWLSWLRLMLFCSCPGGCENCDGRLAPHMTFEQIMQCLECEWRDADTDQTL